MAGVIYKNIRLVGYQYDGNTGFRRSAYSLEVSMNNVAGMEMVKAFDDITQLVVDEYLAANGGRAAYECEAVYIRVSIDTLNQVPTRHPI